jgi:predicted TIM-barrel fold metal-dependent hydrolase
VSSPYRSLFDADNHYYEPRDAFTRHIEPKYRDVAIHLEPGDGRRERLMVGERPFTFLENLFFDTTLKPGSLREMLRNLGSESAAHIDVREEIQPEYTNRDARLRAMDGQGLESVLLFPTLAVCVEHFMKQDVEQTYANVRAFNRWLDEDWGFAHKQRIYAVPLLSLLDVECAVAELEWVIGRGARVIHLRPGPQAGRSPADPIFDPFWARVNEAQLAVAFHISESGYNEMMSVHWGEQGNPPSHRQSAFQWTNFYGDRPISDTLSALILHNLFGRFPSLRVLSVENGSLYVPYLMKVMDKMKGMGRNGPWLGGYVKGRPSEIFRQHVYVSPYHEEDIVALAGVLGPERVLFGSDYPHAEGLAEPASFADRLRGLPEAAVSQIMSENMQRVIAGGF